MQVMNKCQYQDFFRFGIVGGGEVIRNDDYGFGKFSYAVHWELSNQQQDVLRDWLAASNK